MENIKTELEKKNSIVDLIEFETSLKSKSLIYIL